MHSDGRGLERMTRLVCSTPAYTELTALLRSPSLSVLDHVSSRGNPLMVHDPTATMQAAAPTDRTCYM